MQHPTDNLLRSLIDQELPASQADQIHKHLVHCSECQTRFNHIQQRSTQVKAHLDLLAPPARQTTPQQAYQMFIRNTYRRKEILQTMTNRRPLWTALAVIAILAIALSITPVRAWAGSLLSLFRVQKITVVQFDPNQARQLSDSLSINQDAITALLDENLVINSHGDAQPVSSVEEAATLAGFTPRLPSSFQGKDLKFQPEVEADLTIDQPEMQSLLAAIGSDIELPPDVDGKMVSAYVPGAIIAEYGCQTDDTDSVSQCTSFYQMPSPTVDAPEGLDVQGIGSSMLELLGFSHEEAQQISQRIDWTTTLVLPIPQDESIEISEAPVDGVTGTLLVSPTENTFMLLWVKEGMIYALKAPGGSVEAMNLADALQ